MNINSLQCSTQVDQIFNGISGKTINDLVIPTAPVSVTTFPIPVWIQAVDSATNTSIGAIYIDQTDLTYNYSIILVYKSSATGCNSNPIANCACIQVVKKDKAGNSAADNTLPTSVIIDALGTLPIVSIPGGGGGGGGGTNIFGGCASTCDPSLNLCILGSCIQKTYVLYAGAAFLALYLLSMLKK